LGSNPNLSAILPPLAAKGDAGSSDSGAATMNLRKRWRMSEALLLTPLPRFSRKKWPLPEPYENT
jgi:hypothetical protein